jgi:hypothetical protein
MCGRYALYSLILLVGGCSLARVNDSLRPGSARITLARLPDGSQAVRVYYIRSSNFLTQPISRELSDKMETLTMRPGNYTLELDCFRPGAGARVDIGFEFEIAVVADASYVLDCAPGEGDNGFVLTRP